MPYRGMIIRRNQIFTRADVPSEAKTSLFLGHAAKSPFFVVGRKPGSGDKSASSTWRIRDCMANRVLLRDLYVVLMHASIKNK